MKNTKNTLEKLIDRVPAFMHPELDRVETLADLDFQIQHEIDLTEDGSVKWTKAQLHRAKMFYADVHMAADKFALDYPELVDDLNHAVDQTGPSVLQKGSAIAFHDTTDRTDHTGTVVGIKAASSDQHAVCLIHWDDGYRDSWVRQTELREIA